MQPDRRLALMMGLLSLGPAARLQASAGPVRMLIAGLATVTLALFSLSRVGAGSSYFPDLLLPFLLLGLGAGTSFLPLMTLAMADVPDTDAGLVVTAALLSRSPAAPAARPALAPRS